MSEKLTPNPIRSQPLRRKLGWAGIVVSSVAAIAFSFGWGQSGAREIQETSTPQAQASSCNDKFIGMAYIPSGSVEALKNEIEYLMARRRRICTGPGDAKVEYADLNVRVLEEDIWGPVQQLGEFEGAAILNGGIPPGSVLQITQ